MNKEPWELDPTTRFDRRAALYARYRPGYPEAAIDDVLDGLGDPATLCAADLGAGTGILSGLLADRGVGVLAIEPNAEMRAAATERAGIRWIDATAEATGLASDSVDLVVAGQAWHWFEPRKACAEVARILRPGGRLALVWYDDRPGCPVSGRYRQIVKPGAVETFGAHAVEQWTPTLSPPFDLELDIKPIIHEYEYRLDAEGLIGRARSASYVPHCGPDAERLEHEMRELHSQWADEDGLVTLGLICVIHRFRTPDSSDE